MHGGRADRIAAVDRQRGAGHIRRGIAGKIENAVADILMRPKDIDEEGDALVELIRYVCAGTKPIGLGHVLADERGPRYQVVAATSDEIEADSPMHNPFGRLRIASMKDIADGN